MSLLFEDRVAEIWLEVAPKLFFSSSSLLRSSLELGDAEVYEPRIRGLLGTASHFCHLRHPVTDVESNRQKA